MSNGRSSVPTWRLIAALSMCSWLASEPVAAQGLVINEIVAMNEDGLLDEDDAASDWIEIRNMSGSAVDVGGWYLTDTESFLPRWQLPSIAIDPGGFLIVFASGKDRTDPDAPLHTNFRLSGGGEFLALVQPDGVTIEHSFVFPRQREDVSYGLVDGASDVYLSSGSVATFLVPSDDALGSAWLLPEFDDAAWAAGPSGIGYDDSAPPVPDELVNVAPEGTATQSSGWGADQFPAEVAIDGDLGNFTATAADDTDPYWEVDLGEERSIALVVLHNRDNCCPSRLRDMTVTVRDGAGEEVYESALLNPENALGGPDTIPVDLVELTGGMVRGRFVRVARTSDPDLSGTGGAGNADEMNVLSLGEVEVFEGVGGLRGVIGTDVEAEMRDANASLYARFAFEVADAAAVTTLAASIRYDDGFVAYLNGVEIARVNAPGAAGVAVPFDANATAEQPDLSGPGRVEIGLDAFVDVLETGLNVLAIHGLNVWADDVDFVIAVDLRGGSDNGTTFRYFENPTPGAPNDAAGVIGFVGDTAFSVDRGLFVDPFAVEISTPTEGAVIRYTLDGRAPTETSGDVYDGPILIDGTTTLRAAAFKPGFRPTNVDTQTYVFPDDVVEQPQLYDDIVGHAVLGPQVREALELMPSVCVTTSVASIPSTSEVPATVELIHPDGTRGFQIDAGIKRVGGHSLGAYPKNNMRLYFRKRYGLPKLRYPLFEGLAYGGGAIEEFDRLNLRGGAHDTVFYLGADAQSPSNAQYIRNRFMSDMQLEMGRMSLRGRFVHVYLNGAYWGHYHLLESPSAAHAAEYLGGEKDDHEAVRRGAPIGAAAPAWSRIRSIRADREEVQRRLDIPNYVDYMLLNYWAGNDWDWNPNQNWAAAGPSNPDQGGYKMLCWDSDIVLRRTNDDNMDKRGPENLLTSFLPHEEFRIALADGIHRHFYNDGILTPERVADVYRFRADQVADTLIAESARWRWGGRTWLPGNQWQRELDRLLGDFFPRRTDIVIGQMRRAGWFLDIDPPAFRIGNRPMHGGWVDAGDTLLITSDSSETFVDVSLVDFDAEIHAYVPASDALDDEWTNPSYVEGTHGESWRVGPGGVGYDNGSGYDDAIGIDVGAEMSGDGGNPTVYVRIPFVVASQDDLDAIAALRLDIHYDDGFVAYLGGDPVAAAGEPALPTWNSRATSGREANLDAPTEFDITDSIGSLRVGENVLAIHGMNSSPNSSDMLIQAALVAGMLDVDGGGPEILYTLDGSDPREPGAEVFVDPIALDGSVLAKARARSGDSWSALSEATFAIDSGLRITEIMYHPAPPEEGSPHVDEDFEFLELQNVGARAISLDGVAIDGAVRFDFSTGAVPTLAPGEIVVVVNDILAFADRYDLANILVAGEFDGRLSNGGEEIVLRGRAGEHVLDFAWDDAWYPVTDGDGPSLVIDDARIARDGWGLEESWRPSRFLHGSPGFPENDAAGGFQRPGDVNQDSRLDISDAVSLLRYLFVAAADTLPCGDGTLASEGNRLLLDANGDDDVNLSDAVNTLNYLFLAGPAPVLGADCVQLPDCPDRCFQ